MRILINVIISLIFSISIFAQNNNNLSSRINRLITDSLPESVITAIDIYDLTSEKTLFRKNEKLLLRPASNLKLFTSIAGLYFLGPEYNFTTSFYHTGEIVDSVCHGDVYIVGGFDPEFSASDLDSVVSKLKDLGIKKISGNLYGDVSAMDSLYWGKGWMWDDDPYLFSPYLSPLSINKNGIEIAYEPGEIGFPAKINIAPQSKYYSLINSSVTVIEDTSDFNITRDFIGNNNDIIINGTLSFKAAPDTTELNIIHPELYFLALMEERLESNNIQFEGTIQIDTLPGNVKFLLSYQHSFQEVIGNLNKESDNLNAELVLRALAIEKSGKPASAEVGVEMLDSLFALMEMSDRPYRIVDGSGLSFYNLLTAESINEVLKYIYINNPDLFNVLYDSLPIAGIDGALEDRMTKGHAFQNVRAKTGTISGVSCLSGYLTTTDNHFLSFSIMIQNYVGSSLDARKFQDNLCKILCGIKNAKL